MGTELFDLSVVTHLLTYLSLFIPPCNNNDAGDILAKSVTDVAVF